MKSFDEFDGDEILLADGFESAFLGVATQFNTSLACYDHEKCLQILMERDGMGREEAIEFMDFNVTGAFVGKQTPVFLIRYQLEKENKETPDQEA